MIKIEVDTNEAAGVTGNESRTDYVRRVSLEILEQTARARRRGKISNIDMSETPVWFRKAMMMVDNLIKYEDHDVSDSVIAVLGVIDNMGSGLDPAMFDEIWDSVDLLAEAARRCDDVWERIAEYEAEYED